MEASFVIDMLSAALVFLCALYLLFLRPWRVRRLIERRAPSIDLFFMAALLAGAAALHYPEPFTRTAQFLVTQSELPDTLRDVDRRIESIEALPEQIWNDLSETLGWAHPPEPPPPPPETGVVEASVMPSVVGVVEASLRCGVYAGSLLALVLAQLMRLLAGLGQRRRAGNAPGERDLEARVRALEARLQSLPPLPRGPGQESSST